MKRIIAADIGGTNSRFGYFESTEEGLRLIDKIWLPSAAARTFSELMSQLDSSAFPLSVHDADAVALAVAGPIQGRHYVKPTNIAWDIDLNLPEFGAIRPKTRLLNDFLALAYACLSPLRYEADEIWPGELIAGEAIAVIGAGTGLGKACLVSDGTHELFACASEGGHVNLPVESPQEYSFVDWVKHKNSLPYVTCDDVVCGRGLSLIHEFLTKQKLEPREVTECFSSSPDTLRWFSTFYGRTCRNYVLETMARGGVFIAGGIAANNPQILQHPAFEKSFRESRVHGAMLEKVPVFLIDNEDSGLWGSGIYAARH